MSIELIMLFVLPLIVRFCKSKKSKLFTIQIFQQIHAQESAMFSKPNIKTQANPAKKIEQQRRAVLKEAYSTKNQVSFLSKTRIIIKNIKIIYIELPHPHKLHTRPQIHSNVPRPLRKARITVIQKPILKQTQAI